MRESDGDRSREPADVAAGDAGAREGDGSERRAGDGGGLTYREAGVDRAAAERVKDGIGRLVRETFDTNVLSEPGSFGGLYRVPAAVDGATLVASADGVGTKLKVAVRAGRHDTVGQDLVNHCVNDILVEGARPLFFLDYIGMGRLEEGTAEALVSGVAVACRQNGCALLGGETAELPDLYRPGDYDLAGFIVGLTEGDAASRPGAHRVRAGDLLIGLASDGFHTNGYTLLRRLLFDRLGLGVDDPFPELDVPVADVLLRVHRSYLRRLHPLIDRGRIHALAHVTGGGIPDNLARVLPAGLEALVQRSTWERPPEFHAVMERAGLDDDEMYRTFNMGVGIIALARPEYATAVVERLREAGEDAWTLGTVEAGDRGVVLM